MFVDKVCIVHTPQLGYFYPVLLIPLSDAYRPDSMPCLGASAMLGGVTRMTSKISSCRFFGH